MERKQALASAAAGTAALGAAVVAAAALGSYALLGFGGHAPRTRATARPVVAEHIRPKVVTKYEDVYVKRVVNTTIAPSAPAAAPSPVQLVASVPPPTGPPTTLTLPTPAAAVTPETGATPPPPTVSNDAQPTTDPSATSTTLPPNCPRVEYEDNGTWHCDG
jgi:hypothetical protein